VHLHVAEDLVRRGDAGVGADEQLLQLLPDLVVDLAPVEQVRDVAEPALAGAFERLLGLLVRLPGALEDTKNRDLPGVGPF